MHLRHYYGAIKAPFRLYECSMIYEGLYEGSNKGSIKAQHSLGNGFMAQARLSMNIKGSMKDLMTLASHASATHFARPHI